MSKKLKISFKKVLRLSLGSILLVLFMVALVAASRQQDRKVIQGIEVHLNDKSAYSFLQKKDIKKQLSNNGQLKLYQSSVENLNLKQMEAIVEANPWIANAEIYVDNRKILQVEVTQRNPVIRIFDAQGDSYYLDSTAVIMPIRIGYTYPAIVFTNVPIFSSDSLNANLKAKMIYLGEEISRDSFWSAQITQIKVLPNQTFIASALLGNQQIIIGDTNRIHEKLFNLFEFYRHVPRKIGWNAYETLDLRFKGQIVAAPTLDAIQPKIEFNEPQQIVDQKKTEPKETINHPQKVLKNKEEIKENKEINKKEKTKQTETKQPKYIYKG